MPSPIEIYLQSLRQFCPDLTEIETTQFASKCIIKEFKKKEFFLQSGKVQKELGFITKGLVRSFYIDDSGLQTSCSLTWAGRRGHCFLWANKSYLSGTNIF